MILLDTNLVSELMKPAPDPKVEHWFLLNEEESALSAVTLGELSYGVARLRESARQRMLEAKLVEWRLRYAGRTLLYGSGAAWRYGRIQADAECDGRPMSLPDAQIAAVALEEDAALATRNVKDFERSGVRLVNPWA